MKTYLLFVLVLWASRTVAQGILHGTAVAAIRTPSEIVVAADSKEVNGDGSANTNLVCKIRQIGDMFFTVNAMNSQSATGFDAFQIIEGAARAKGTLDQILTRSIDALRTPLENAVNYVRTNNPSEFEKNFTKHDALGVMIFGVENGDIVLCSVTFAANGSPEKPVSISIVRYCCPGPDCHGGNALSLVGPNETATFEFQKANPEYWKADLVALSRSFVESQIKADPADCGPPIDIVRLTKNGPEWIARKKECLPPVNP